MLRPGGFVEYSPAQQKVFDVVYDSIQKIFTLHGYQHIYTPAVESIQVLKKGGDEVTKQIFGLYGLAQGPTDTKEYGLHFDLTIPFARYVLDWQDQLAFPFKRYQIQPVRRGERSQKGRYKEFWQADIDVIRKTQENKNYNAIYDAECVFVLAKTVHTILTILGINARLVVCYNHRNCMYDICTRLKIKDTQALFGLLDKYYKMPEDVFVAHLHKFLTDKQITQLQKLWSLDVHLDQFPEVTTYLYPFTKQLQIFLKNNPLEGVEFVYDPSIVRGLDYYTGIVFETFLDSRHELGSICSGGAYARLTDFLDTKYSFSGVGGSIGLTRLLSILFDNYRIQQDILTRESYLLIHQPDTYARTIQILAQLHKKGKIAELYPLPEKIEKQFRYAEKKGITDVVHIIDGVVKGKKLGGDWYIFFIQ